MPESASIDERGVAQTLIRNVTNIAVISPASGFEDYACSAARIVEFNCGVGQGVGIAMAICLAASPNALLENRHLAGISDPEVREVLLDTQRLPKIYGVSYLEKARQLDVFENLIA